MSSAPINNRACSKFRKQCTNASSHKKMCSGNRHNEVEVQAGGQAHKTFYCRHIVWSQYFRGFHFPTKALNVYCDQSPTPPPPPRTQTPQVAPKLYPSLAYILWGHEIVFWRNGKDAKEQMHASIVTPHGTYNLKLTTELHTQSAQADRTLGQKERDHNE